MCSWPKNIRIIIQSVINVNFNSIKVASAVARDSGGYFESLRKLYTEKMFHVLQVNVSCKACVVNINSAQRFNKYMDIAHIID